MVNNNEVNDSAAGIRRASSWPYGNKNNKTILILYY